MGAAKLFYAGLDYAGVRARLEARLAGDPDLWDGLQVLELAARDALNG